MRKYHKRKYHKDEIVWIRAIRHPDGSGTSIVSSDHPAWESYPVMMARVAQVDVCGSPGCYGLVWEDTREPIGLPFFASYFCDADGIQMDQ